jgi:hypothetical protein
MPCLTRLEEHNLSEAGLNNHKYLTTRMSNVHIVGDMSYKILVGYSNISRKIGFRVFNTVKENGVMKLDSLARYNVGVDDLFQLLPPELSEYILFDSDILSALDFGSNIVVRPGYEGDL